METFIPNESLMAEGKPCRFIETRELDCAFQIIKVQFDNGEVDWFSVEDVRRVS